MKKALLILLLLASVISANSIKVDTLTLIQLEKEYQESFSNVEVLITRIKKNHFYGI